MSKEADTTIPPIQSAYLNILTAVSDADDAKDAWGRYRWDDAIMHIDLAIEQLQSAKYKIQHHKQK
jgi:hypothetical protein